MAVVKVKESRSKKVKRTPRKRPSKARFAKALRIAKADKASKKTAKKSKTLTKVKEFSPKIVATSMFPYRVNDGDLFRPLREEVKEKLVKHGDSMELNGQPGQSYDDLYNRLSSVMFRPEFPKPAKGLQYIRRRGKSIRCVDVDDIAIDDAPVVLLILAKKGTKIPRSPRKKKVETK